MFKNVVLALVAVVATAVAVGESKASVVISGETVQVAAGFTGQIDVGIFLTSDIDTTITGYNIPLLVPNPSQFVEFDAQAFNFSNDGTQILSPPAFQANRGLTGAGGTLGVTAGTSAQIGRVTFNVTQPVNGYTELATMLDSGFESNFFTFSTLDGTQNATNGGATIGSALAVSAPTAVPEPSSLAALGVLGLVSGAIRRRRKAAKA